MAHEIDLSKYSVRTDLAIDEVENKKIDGITSRETSHDKVKVTDVIVDDVGSKSINKKPGRYITVEFDDVTDHDNKEKVQKVFSSELKKLLSEFNLNEDSKCLIVGLGNRESTPDALGPLTISKVLVTNHLFSIGEVEEGFRPVSAFAPGVMGQTGVETGDVINAIVGAAKPDFVIVVDALASGAITRLNKTIQMTDTGIHPGSGVGNSRKEISKDTISIPVIAIGIPTVVDAVTIVGDTIDYMYKHFSYTKKNIDNPMNKLAFGSVNYLKKDIKVDEEEKKKLFGMLGTLDPFETRELIYEVLSPVGYNLMVTPKEVDFVIEKLSDVIGNGINEALHQKVNFDY